MAVRARLSPPKEATTAWPWHKPEFIEMPVSTLLVGDRRMEAENYLSGGHGHRLALSAKAKTQFGNVANVWQPSRLKGITVSQDFGTSFLAATQVFDQRPIARKFLSLDKTDSAPDRFAEVGTILVTCSGAVGRATLATSALDGVLISHDLLRIAPKDEKLWGWLYAFLRASSVREMMSAAQYGHVIKHLEVAHVAQMPMPMPTDAVAARFRTSAEEVLRSRNDAGKLMSRAEALFEESVGLPAARLDPETSFSVSSAMLSSGRRRLEGNFHSPLVQTLMQHFSERKLKLSRLAELGFDIWLPTRFRRIPAAEGVKLVGSADLFEINPDLTKRIADGDFGDRARGRVQRGWLLLARSGQTYGLNGTLAIANEFHEGKVVSDHVIRIAPRAECSVRAGYVYTALSHPTLGRPLVKALAYGSSIPEIDVADVAELRIVRLGKLEEEIADLAEEGAAKFAAADIVETQMAQEADDMLRRFLAGDTSELGGLGA